MSWEVKNIYSRPVSLETLGVDLKEFVIDRDEAERILNNIEKKPECTAPRVVKYLKEQRTAAAGAINEIDRNFFPAGEDDKLESIV